jgi:EpsI family protein
MDKSKAAAGVAIALSLLVGSAAYALRMQRSAPETDSIRFDSLPLQFDRYLGTEEWFDSATYAVLKADTTTYRRYVDTAGVPIWLFVAYFGAQNYGEQIHSPRNCLPGGGWNILSLDRVPLNLPDRGDVVTNRLLIESGGHSQVMYYFFITRMGPVASEYRLKLELARAALTFRPRDALFVRVSSPVVESGPEAADERCRQLLTGAMPLLAQGVPF